MGPPAQPRARYHHGDLRNALIEAGVDLARAGGPRAVVLREAARVVGVSHNAGYRHFADRAHLLDAVAQRGMGELARAMRAALADLPSQPDATAAAGARLRAVGRAYVRFALAEPGLFHTAFTAAEEHPDRAATDPAPPGQDLDPYALLNGALDDATTAGLLPAERRPGAEITAWSAVHGLAGLLLDGPLAALPAEQRDIAVERLLDTVTRGLS